MIEPELIENTYSIRFNESVLFVGCDQFGESSQKSFDTRSTHLNELTGNQNLSAGFGHDSTGQ